jgi:hypothetical protein
LFGKKNGYNFGIKTERRVDYVPRPGEYEGGNMTKKKGGVKIGTQERNTLSTLLGQSKSI